MRNWDHRYASRVRHMTASEIRELLKFLDQPDLVSFAGGIPDPELFPHEEIARAFADILNNPMSASTALQYSVSEGYLPLRQWIAGYMGTLGLPCAPENILITNGSQQGLDFLGKLFLDLGDVVYVTRPTYLGALQAFTAYQPRFANFPESGVAPEKGVKLGYVMPDFQNPSGVRLSLVERTEILEAAYTHDVTLIEDAAYEALRYEGDAITPIVSIDAERSGGIEKSRVVYCGTFSKTIAPGLRVGWIAASRELISKLVLVKQAADLHSGSLVQIAIHDVVSKCFFDRLPLIRDTYRARRDAMVDALAREMPPGVEWTRPEGGMFVWLTLPSGIDTARLLERAVRETKIAFVPGGAFHFDGTGRNTLRLSFSLSDEAKIDLGIARLGGLLKSAAPQV
jgi:DNA-binding transcriptional MocR family regulator